MTLLILDRESASRRQLYDLFVGRFESVAVRSFFGACRLLRHHEFDAILVKTAGMDGFAIALLNWLQAHRISNGTIALLDRGARDEAELLHRLGAGAILRWPASGRDVRRAVCDVALRHLVRDSAAGANGDGAHAIRAPRLLPLHADGRNPGKRKHRCSRGIPRCYVSFGAQLACNN